MRRLLTQIAVLALAATGVSLEAETRADWRTVPFRDAPLPYVIISVPIKGGSCEPLLFDTGTNLSRLAPSLASRLGLTHGRSTTVSATQGEGQGTLGHVTGLGWDVTNRDEPGLAISSDMTGLRRLIGPVSGIYGQGLLGSVDYLLDYKTRRLILAPSRDLAPMIAGERIPIIWSEGRPALTATVQARKGRAPFAVRLVLDSGIDHAVLFGKLADDVSRNGLSTAVTVETAFGSRIAEVASVTLRVAGRDRRLDVALMPEKRDRDEDGLLPTSVFKSVLISPIEGVVVVDGELAVPEVEKKSLACRP